jgi:hypothetical protein
VEHDTPVTQAITLASISGGAPWDREGSGIFDELRRPLFRYFLCAGLSREDADEGIQETFLRLHQHLRKDGDRSNLRGWIFQVARNLAAALGALLFLGVILIHRPSPGCRTQLLTNRSSQFHMSSRSISMKQPR